MRGRDGGPGGAASFLLCERTKKKMKITRQGRERTTDRTIVIQTTFRTLLDFSCICGHKKLKFFQLD